LKLILDTFTIYAGNQGERFLVFTEVNCTSEKSGLLINPAFSLVSLLVLDLEIRFNRRHSGKVIKPNANLSHRIV